MCLNTCGTGSGIFSKDVEKVPTNLNKVGLQRPTLTIEQHSCAATNVEAHYRVNNPDKGRNSRGRGIILKGPHYGCKTI